MKTSNPTFYLYDTHSQIHRAYHAPFRNLSCVCLDCDGSGNNRYLGRDNDEIIEDCATCDGTGFEPTKATFMFTKNLIQMLDTHRPDYIVMAMDGKRKDLKKRDLSPQYKSGRGEHPVDFYPQVLRIRQIIAFMGLQQVAVKGYEADDIIATFVANTHYNTPPISRVIVSRDKDLMQLINVNCRMYDPMEDLFIDGRYVMKKYGISNIQLRDYLSIVGDKSDNISGVRGIGPVGAVALLKDHLTVKNFYNKIIRKKTPTEQKMWDQRDEYRLSRKLVQLCDTVPVPDEPLEFYRTPTDIPKKARVLFRRLGFNSFTRSI